MKLTLVPKRPLVLEANHFLPQNTKFWIVSKRLFFFWPWNRVNKLYINGYSSFWLQTTKIELNQPIFQWTFNNSWKPGKTITSFKTYLKILKKRIHRFCYSVCFVFLVFRPLTQLPNSYCKMITGVQFLKFLCFIVKKRMTIWVQF